MIGSTLIAALLFRTYGYEVTPFALELARHFHILFMACELFVVWLGLRSGLDLGGLWRRLAICDRFALALFLATFAVGSVLSQQPGYSLITVSSWPIHLLFGASIWHLARPDGHALQQTTRVIGTGIALVLAGLLAITGLHFAHAPVTANTVGGGVFWAGAVPGFMGVRLFGVVVCYAALFGAGMILCGDRAHDRRLGIALLLVGFAAMCWSATRAALPAFFAGMVVVAVAADRWRSGRAWLVVIATIAGALALSLLVPAPDASFGTANLFGSQRSAGGDLTAGRMEIWRAVIAAIAERPWFGHGEGATRWLLPGGNSMHVQPHNAILQIVLHWGVPAAAAAAWLAGRMAWTVIAVVRWEPGLAPYAMIVVASGVAAMFDGALYYPQIVMLPAAALAFVLAQRSAEGNETSKV